MLTVARGLDLGQLRAHEFARLERSGLAYLDYGGSALYAESQVRDHAARLQEGLFGNPHSDSAPSRASTEILAAGRRRVLAFLDADDESHVVCFTANASGAIRLVAESYPFDASTACVLSVDNHNSVNGIREYARRAGASLRTLPLEGEVAPCLRLREPKVVLEDEAARGRTGLVAFPAQSNFSGVRHPLELVAEARSLGFDVLLDAASFAGSCALSLRRCPADFVALSFYKLFGYPTGLGALVARREALARLRRPWFAGGTVTYASVQADSHRWRPGAEGFEDGTPGFLDVGALEPGFALLDEVGMDRLGAHVARLTARLLEGLLALHHRDGAPLVVVYGPRDDVDRGGVVTFNVCNGDGSVRPYGEVEEAARRAGVAVRGGCICNPGAAEVAFGYEPARATECLRLLGAAFTVARFAECLGRPVGAVRASLGLANDERDIDRLIAVVGAFRD